MKKSNNTIIIVITTLVLILGIIVYDRLTNIPYRPIKYMNTVNYKTQNMTYENLPKYDGKIIQSYEDYKNDLNKKISNNEEISSMKRKKKFVEEEIVIDFNII